ncbi:MAG: hypothetical protein WCV68_02895 [Candidatus Paceibacterota bacterium]
MSTFGDLANELVGDESPSGGKESNIRIKINVKESSEKLAKKLNGLVSAGHANVAFSAIITLTLAKDLIGLIPIFGDAIALVVSGGIYIFMFTKKGLLFNKKMKITFWVLNGLIAFIPYVDIVLVPGNISTIFYAWYLTKRRMRKAEKKLAILGQLTYEEMEALNNNIDLIDEEGEGAYSSKGTLNIRSEKIISEAKKIIRESDNQDRPTKKAAINDGVKRAESFRRTRQIAKASEETNPDGTKKLSDEYLKSLREPEAKEYKVSTPNDAYVEFDQKTGGLVPAEKEEEKPDDWPIAI